MMLGFAILLTVMLLGVCYFDITRFIIPNELNLAFILIYPVFVMLSPAHIEWWMSLAVMVAFFAVGFLIFIANIMGGGDIKLLIALSLWIGWQPNALIEFGIGVSLSGGILALFLLFFRVMFRKMKDKNKLPKVLKWKEPMPYGLAIAYAFGALLWTNHISGLVIK